MDTRFAVAIHILVLVGSRHGRGLPAEVIARSVGTHPVRVRQLLGRLNRAGFTTTRRGRDGGTFLLKRPEEVSLAEVWEAVYDDPVLLPVHETADRRCPVGRVIGVALHAPFAMVEASMMEVLGTTTLAKIAGAVSRGFRRVTP